MKLSSERRSHSGKDAAARGVATASEILEAPGELADLAAELCATPVALIAFIDGDQRWLEAGAGFDALELPRADTFFDETLSASAPLVVADASQDGRFKDHPLVAGAPGLRFYAGVPLLVAGEAVGVLGVFDLMPRPEGLTGRQLRSLGALASRAATELQLRRAVRTAEHRLRESEAHYRARMELSSQIPWAAEPGGMVTEVSPRYAALTGLSEDEVLGTGWRISLHPDDVVAVWRAWRHAVSTGEPYDVRHRLRLHDGAYRWFRCRARPLKEEGRILRWYGALEDIHEQVEAELALRESEEHYRHTVELHPQLSWTADLQGNIVTADRRMKERTGADPVEVQRHGWLAVAHPDDKPAVRAAMVRSAATGDPFDVKYRARMADGTYRWVRAQAYPRRNEAGEIIRWYGSNTDIHEQELVQQRLAESEARLRLAQDAAGIGIWDIDLETGLVTLSPRSLEMLNLPADRDGVIGGPEAWGALIHPDDRAAGMTVTRRAIETGGPYDYLFRVPIPTGGVRWIQGLGRTEYGPDGRPRRVTGINLDVTKRIEAEQAERQAVERYRLTARAANDAVYDWDVVADTHEWNEAVTTHFGYPPAYIDPSSGWWRDKLHPDDQERVAASLQMAMDGDAMTWAAEYRFRRADGTYADVYDRGAFLRDEQGRVVRLVGAMIDLTEQKRAENRLRESEARFRQMADTAPVMIWMTEPDGSTSFVSRRWCEFTGQAESEVLGFGWSDALHPEDRDRTLKTFLSANAAKAAYRSEYRLRRADGEYRWILDVASPRLSDDGEFHGYIGSSIDISDRKEAEAELERAHLDLLRLSRLSAMGAMASTLAHELNQPLTAATQYLGACEMLFDIDPADPRIRELWALAEAQTLRAGDIIRRIRSFTMEGQIRRRTEDLEKIADRAITFVKARPDAGDVTFSMSFAPDAKLVDVDPIQIEQVLTNLMRNAIEAMTESPVRRITLTARRRSDKIDLFVADTGPGLSPQMHHNLFQPFGSSKSEGMGLGLPLCRTIVEAHGGHMWTEAPDGHGAVIVLSLPASGAQPETATI